MITPNIKEKLILTTIEKPILIIKFYTYYNLYGSFLELHILNERSSLFDYPS